MSGNLKRVRHAMHVIKNPFEQLSDALVGLILQFTTIHEHAWLMNQVCKRLNQLGRLSSSWDPNMDLYSNLRNPRQSLVFLQGLGQANARPKKVHLQFSPNLIENDKDREQYCVQLTSPGTGLVQSLAQLTKNVQKLELVFSAFPSGFEPDAILRHVQCTSKLNSVYYDGHLSVPGVKWMQDHLKIGSIQSLHIKLPFPSQEQRNTGHLWEERLYGLTQTVLPTVLSFMVYTPKQLKACLSHLPHLDELIIGAPYPVQTIRGQDLKILQESKVCSTLRQLDLSALHHYPRDDDCLYYLSGLSNLQSLWLDDPWFDSMCTIRERPTFSNGDLNWLSGKWFPHLVELGLSMSIWSLGPAHEENMVHFVERFPNLTILSIRFHGTRKRWLHPMMHRKMNKTLANTYGAKGKICKRLKQFNLWGDENINNKQLEAVLNNMPELEHFGCSTLILTGAILEPLKKLKKLRSLRLCLKSPLSNLTREMVEFELPNLVDGLEESDVPTTTDLKHWKGTCLFCVQSNDPKETHCKHCRETLLKF